MRDLDPTRERCGNQRRRYYAGMASTRRRPIRTTCAASDPSSELVPDPSRRSDDDSTSSDTEGISNDDDARLSQRALLLLATGDSEEQQEEEQEQEETGWVGETLSKGAEAVVSGVKSAARASKPLRREADGRIVPDGDGLLNLCILVFSGLWIVHSIVTVDATMWRGWTLQETLIRLPWDNWDSYETGLQEHPIITKTAINVGIYLIGDWLSQVKWGREEDVALWEFDLQRTLRNGLIGACFGPVVHFYYNFSDWVLPPSVPINRPFKIMLDQSIYFCSKCAVYILLVSYIILPAHASVGGSVRVCALFFFARVVVLAFDPLLIFIVRETMHSTLETRFKRARHPSVAFVVVAAAVVDALVVVIACVPRNVVTCNQHMPTFRSKPSGIPYQSKRKKTKISLRGLYRRPRKSHFLYSRIVPGY
ncbi:unnamed protein product [Ectocarpus sp. 12 AP-2014]